MWLCGLGQEIACWFYCLKNQLVSFGQSNNTGVIDVIMDGSAFSSKLYWGSNITITQTASKKIEALIHSLKFLSPDVALYLDKSTIWPSMEYCCHVWTGVPSCFLKLLDKLQKWICKTVCPALSASIEYLAHCRNEAGLMLLLALLFGRYSSKLAHLVPLPYSEGRSSRYYDRLHDFSVTIPRRLYKNAYVNSFFPFTFRLSDCLPVKYFPLTYDLND